MNNIIYDQLERDLKHMETEVFAIMESAAVISDKFKGLGQDIKDLSGFVSFVAGKKMGVVTNIAGFLIEAYGDVAANIEKEKMLKQLLLKKKELARAKYEIVSHVLNQSIIHREQFLKLLNDESERIIDDLDEYERLHSKTGMITLDMNLRIEKIIQLCKFSLAEFDAWRVGKHNCDLNKPLNAEIYLKILNILLPNGIAYAMQHHTNKASYWLFTRAPFLFGAYINHIYDTNDMIDKKYEEIYRVFKHRNYIEIKKEIRKFELLDKHVQDSRLKWLHQNEFYNIFKESSIFSRLKIENINLHFLLYGLITAITLMIYSEMTLAYSIVITVIISLLCRFYYYYKIDYKEETDNYKELLAIYFISFMTLIFSFGTIPFTYYWYKKKEDDYKLAISTLKFRLEEKSTPNFSYNDQYNNSFLSKICFFFKKNAFAKIMIIIYTILCILIVFFPKYMFEKNIKKENIQQKETPVLLEEVITTPEKTYENIEPVVIEEVAPINDNDPITLNLKLIDGFDVDGILVLDFISENGVQIQFTSIESTIIDTYFKTNEYDVLEIDPEYLNKKFKVSYVSKKIINEELQANGEDGEYIGEHIVKMTPFFEN